MGDMYQFLELDPMHLPRTNGKNQFDCRYSSWNAHIGNTQKQEVEP